MLLRQIPDFFAHFEAGFVEFPGFFGSFGGGGKIAHGFARRLYDSALFVID